MRARALLLCLAILLVTGCEYVRMQPSQSNAPLRPPPVNLP